MAYLVYARRFRPQTFAEVVGQESVVASLREAIRRGRVGHAYLFCGPRGVGKTTSARILAKALNCEKGPAPDPCGECASCREIASGSSLDVIEIDAASHASVDDVRALREAAGYSTHRSRYRVYIIDEVHMLATSSQQAAFNAFLKILEEPPPHVKFILCTTDPQRIIETVRSRCQRLDFRRITLADVVSRLRQIAEREELEVSDEALREIARHAEGGLRDAEVLLEQLSVYAGGAASAGGDGAAGGRITVEHVRALTGAIDEAKLARIAGSLAGGRAGDALEEADAILESGTDSGELLDALLAHLRSALAVQACGERSPLVAARGIDVEAACATADALRQEELLYAAAVLQAARKEARASSQPRMALELALVRLSRIKELVSLEEIAGEVASRLEGGPPRPRERSGRGASPGDRGGRGSEGPRRNPSPGREGAGRPRAESRMVAAGRERPVAEEPPRPDAPGASDGPPPPAPEGALTLENVSERWPFIQAATSSRSVAAGAYLSKGVLSAVRGDTLLVGFPGKWAFHRAELSNAENLSAAEGAASEILGRAVTLKLTALRAGRAGAGKGPLRGGGSSGRPVPRAVPRDEAEAGDETDAEDETEAGGARGRPTSGEAVGAAGGSGPRRGPSTDSDPRPEHVERRGRERPAADALRDPGIRMLVRKTGGAIVRVERRRDERRRDERRREEP